MPGSEEQWVVSRSADPGIRSPIPARSHTFMEFDHKIIFNVILLLPLIQEGLLSVTSESMCTKLGDNCIQNFHLGVISSDIWSEI